MKKESIFLLIALLNFNLSVQAQSFPNRSALIIGISNYSPISGANSLPGVTYDMESAKKIALEMGIPESNIRYLRDSQATKANIMSELRSLGETSLDGSRALVYFSGHGFRQFNPSTGNCSEGLLTYEGTSVTNADFANATQKLAKSADKVITMVDACFSQGVINSRTSTGSMRHQVLHVCFPN